jgi:hypothetical protein
VVGRDYALAGAATSRRPAAAATAATAAAGAPSASAASAAAASAASPPSHLLTGLGLRGVFLVENVECREADVGELFLTEEDFLTRRGILGRCICCWSARRCGRSSYQRKGHPGDSKDREGLLQTRLLRRLLLLRHRRDLRCIANSARQKNRSIFQVHCLGHRRGRVVAPYSAGATPYKPGNQRWRCRSDHWPKRSM